MFNSDLFNHFIRTQVNMFSSASAIMFTSASVNTFTSGLSNMFTSDLTNMFTSASANMFISDLVNMFHRDLANEFTSDLEKCKKMIRPTCFQVKLTDENVGLAPGIRHMIRPRKNVQAFPIYIPFQKAFPLHHTVIFTIHFSGKLKTHADI